MAGKSIVLSIEKLAGLGDGMGFAEGRRLFVPYTLPGDLVRARIVRETKDAAYAALEEVITPGENRIAPVCGHFAQCGGCALQHVREDAYADFKLQTARQAVRKAGFDPACVLPLIRLPPASRRRVELKAEESRLGYYAERSHRLVDIEECKVLEPALEALVMRLKPQLAALPGVSGVHINGVDEGYDILLTEAAFPPLAPPAGGGRIPGSPSRLREGLGEGITDDPEIRRISVREGAALSTLYQSGPVTVTLGEVSVEIPPGAFLQASREAQAVMTRHVLEAVGQAGRVLDLFAGIGTYSFPLAAQAQVTAAEGDAAMVEAMRAATLRHGLGQRFKAQMRDLFRDPVDRFEGYDAVVINPPRTGAKAQVERLARRPAKVLVMVSCNPATFARDARLLKEGGYKLNKVLPVDQFVYTPHLEMVADFFT